MFNICAVMRNLTRVEASGVDANAEMCLVIRIIKFSGGTCERGRETCERGIEREGTTSALM